MEKLHIKTLLALIMAFSFGLLFAEDEPTQNLRGQVIDQESRQPLVGAKVVIMRNAELLAGTQTDSLGKFYFEALPLGAVILEVSYYGYGKYRKDNLYLTAAREEIQNIEMISESVEIDGVEIVYQTVPNAPINKMQVASSRSFTPELGKKAAGAVDDPSRLVMGFPGVQGPQDNNSDLVIRGNSPVGLLWRLEGIDIANPNHFARKGSSGGGITILSAQVLGESDFSTGAWSAEYGNAFSGVMDLRFRKGNSNAFQGRGKFSLLGIEAAAEGPLGKNSNSSYLINYRYSTLGILSAMGFRLVDPRVGNTYQDLSFNFFFPLKNNKTFVSVFGVGGYSVELWDAIEDSLTWSRDYRTTTDFITRTGVTGVTLSHNIDQNSYLKAVVAVTGSRVVDDDDTLDVSGLQPLRPFTPNSLDIVEPLLETKSPWDEEDYRDWRISTHIFYNRKLGDIGSFRVGALATQINFSFQQNRQIDPTTTTLTPILGGEGGSQLLQGYSQFSFRPGRWVINPGVHAMYLALNGKAVVDPRLSIKYRLSERHSAYAAYGLHSSILPLGNYFTEVDGEQVNRDLDMIRSNHIVGGLEMILGTNKDYKVVLEGYYQQMDNVPVVDNADSTFWLLNLRDGYATSDLVSEGKGYNYGVDLSLERSFRNGAFFLISGSVYNSRFSTLYGGGDTLFNTRYNGNYSISAMASKEWGLGAPGNIFQISTRVISNGGLRYSPGDVELSRAAGYLVPIPSQTYSMRVGHYFRIDGKASYRFNTKNGRTWLVHIEAQNFVNRLNRRDLIWDAGLDDFRFRYQAGIIPNIGLQMDF